MTQDSRFPNLFILDHPLIQHKLTHMRDKDTSTRTFRELLREITLLMGYEITRALPMTTRRVQTPLVEVDAPVIAGKKLAIVPVLRAGVGMSDGLLELIPSARVGHIGVYRAEDHRPVVYLVRLPDLEDRTFILCDPMVATGYSAAHAIDVLKRRGVPGERILFLALVAAPEGVDVFQTAHPDVKLDVASLDSHLNEHAYIVPGLGDAGDRLFGTKNYASGAHGRSPTPLAHAARPRRSPTPVALPQPRSHPRRRRRAASSRRRAKPDRSGVIKFRST